jgi:hypothetical protein
VSNEKCYLALFARDVIAAKSDYQLEAEVVVARTARLRAQRLERDAVIARSGQSDKVIRIGYR